MSWRERAKANLGETPILEKGASPVLTKLTKPPFVGSVSSRPAPIPADDGDPTDEELNEMDRLIVELSDMEGWPKEELQRVRDERSRMALANVRKALRRLRLSHRNALAIWPTPPQKRSRVVLCELELVVIDGGLK